MNFLKKLFGGPARGDDRLTSIYVMSYRCKEPLEGKVDLFNELSKDDDGKGYYVRKVLHTSGRDRCFSEVEVQLWFDSKKQVSDHDVSGGRWLTADEYDEELAIFNAPPEEDEEADDEIDESGEDTGEKDAEITTVETESADDDTEKA
jgi:hypothetical protein